jgi:tRNA(fMet)-specific endonuclease VapC
MVISRLLDTNTVAELAKNVPNESVIEQIKRHDQELAIASVVWHELLYGWYSGVATLYRTRVS